MVWSSGTAGPLFRLCFAIVTTICVGAGIAVTVLSASHYYPGLKVLGPRGNDFQILETGQKNLIDCNRVVASLTAAVIASCPSCRVEKAACAKELSDEGRNWLGTEPIHQHSVRTTDGGVIVFEGPDEHLALASCNASEERAHQSAPDYALKCYPANQSRPYFQERTDSLAKVSRDVFLPIGPVLAILLFCAIFVSVACVAAVRALAAWDPTHHRDHPHNRSATFSANVKVSNVMKRALDIFLAITVLAVLSPLLLLISVALCIIEGSPIFYVSKRYVARNKSVFVYKFRTMVRNATAPQYRLKERYMRDGYLDIPLDCEVYTPIGRLLERSQIVEVLQLINVFSSGMSFVGNRPLPKDNLDLLQKFTGWADRFDSPAGITGIAQIAGKYGLSPQQRLLLERMYASIYKNPAANILTCDLAIIAYTLYLLLTGRYLGFNKAIMLLTHFGADERLLLPVDPVLQSGEN